MIFKHRNGKKLKVIELDDASGYGIFKGWNDCTPYVVGRVDGNQEFYHGTYCTNLAKARKVWKEKIKDWR